MTPAVEWDVLLTVIGLGFYLGDKLDKSLSGFWIGRTGKWGGERCSIPWRTIWLFGLALVSVLAYCIRNGIANHGGALANDAAAYDLTSLALASDPAAVRIILANWTPDQRFWAECGAVADILFVVAYVAFMHFLCWWATRQLQERRPRAAWVGNILDVLPFAAGFCELAEIPTVWYMLHGAGDQLAWLAP